MREKRVHRRQGQRCGEGATEGDTDNCWSGACKGCVPAVLCLCRLRTAIPNELRCLIAPG